MSIVQDSALTVAIVSQYGVQAAYHIITSLVPDDINQQLTVNVKSYSSKQDYLSGMSPLMMNSYITQAAADYLAIINSESLITAAYAFLSTQIVS